MRFAIATVDRYLGVFETFVRTGWQPLKLFTVPKRNEMGNQQAVIAFAEQHKAAIQLSRMTEDDLRVLQTQGCDALIVASYDWIIPGWRPFLKYAVNFHGAPLPEGRGPYPVVRAVLENRNQWGIACHRLTQEIDAGEILAIEKFPLRADECHESLDLKIQMAGKKLATTVAGQFVKLWEKAQPQNGGNYWPKQTLTERVIYFQKPVENILRHIRAFGSTESLACINGTWLIVKRAVGWVEPHRHRPGEAVHVFNRYIVVAATDGFIGLLESELAPPQVVTGVQAEMKEQMEALQPSARNERG